MPLRKRNNRRTGLLGPGAGSFALFIFFQAGGLELLPRPLGQQKRPAARDTPQESFSLSFLVSSLLFLSCPLLLLLSSLSFSHPLRQRHPSFLRSLPLFLTLSLINIHSSIHYPPPTSHLLSSTTSSVVSFCLLFSSLLCSLSSIGTFHARLLSPFFPPSFPPSSFQSDRQANRVQVDNGHLARLAAATETDKHRLAPCPPLQRDSTLLFCFFLSFLLPSSPFFSLASFFCHSSPHPTHGPCQSAPERISLTRVPSFFFYLHVDSSRLLSCLEFHVHCFHRFLCSSARPQQRHDHKLGFCCTSRRLSAPH